MAEESTRRLLKLFGIAVTNFEETVQSLQASLAGLHGKDPAGVIQPLEDYLKTSGELMRQWAAVGQLLAETHQKADAQLLATLAQLKK